MVDVDDVDVVVLGASVVEVVDDVVVVVDSMVVVDDVDVDGSCGSVVVVVGRLDEELVVVS